MRKIHCLNPISRYGTELFTDGYEMTDRMEEADSETIEKLKKISGMKRVRVIR